ncbi:septum site-determining protein Ssd [Nocardia huaxiensis]|uniref:Rv3660c-like CheY-like N-terminal domain-containing protein n=1 Tax=Nocardia huaxiensis TaxID=2755382 RepID=A0A7D6VJB1_9NOCA|nr:septum site-determining protein Ssd [Nocardia huaxiensis]QLY31376.1 hypothetical protein H0264_03175 [Nocardia huaxiensis]UFS94921.1 CpaE-like family protein [Nocardia huaxiensis]
MNFDATTAAPALAAITDARLREEVRRIAAAADRPLEEHSAPLGRHAWTAGAVIILDTPAARQCISGDCPRRPGILLITGEEPGLLDWQTAAEIGAEQVLPLPAAADTLIAAFTAHDHRTRDDGVVVAVAGASGGSGASTLSAAIAIAAATRFRDHTLLLDAAPYGGGIDLLLGIETTPGPRWPDLTIETGRISAAALHEALPALAGVSVLSCGRASTATELTPTAVRAVLDATRAAGNLVVCDLSTERAPHATHILETADLVILTVPAHLRALAAAESAAARLTARNPNVHLIVRGPAPGGLRAREIADALHLPLLAAVRPQPGLSERLERGGLTVRRRGPLRTAAEAVLDALVEVDTTRPISPARRAPRPIPHRPQWPAARSTARIPLRPSMDTCSDPVGAR